MEVTNSGILVPIETKVIPIILSLMPNELAKSIAPEKALSQNIAPQLPSRNKQESFSL